MKTGGTSIVAEQYSYKFVKKALSEIFDSNIKKPYVIEIASNDGTFLKNFKKYDKNEKLRKWLL